MINKLSFWVGKFVSFAILVVSICLSISAMVWAIRFLVNIVG